MQTAHLPRTLVDQARLMSLEELAAKLDELEDTRKVLELEFEALERSQQEAEGLEQTAAPC